MMNANVATTGINQDHTNVEIERVCANRNRRATHNRRQSAQYNLGWQHFLSKTHRKEVTLNGGDCIVDDTSQVIGLCQEVTASV